MELIPLNAVIAAITVKSSYFGLKGDKSDVFQIAAANISQQELFINKKIKKYFQVLLIHSNVKTQAAPLNRVALRLP